MVVGGLGIGPLGKGSVGTEDQDWNQEEVQVHPNAAKRPRQYTSVVDLFPSQDFFKDVTQFFDLVR